VGADGKPDRLGFHPFTDLVACPRAAVSVQRDLVQPVCPKMRNASVANDGLILLAIALAFTAA
jgi:hypothetical protein